MVLQNPNTVALRSNILNNRDGNANRNVSHQRPIVDLLVAMIAVPVLILLALQLEKNLHDMSASPESRWKVFALGIGMLVISVIICGYVTHRMGVCIWAGPLDEAGNRLDSRGMPYINSQNDILSIIDSLPPSYESVVKFDIPPPPYENVIIDVEPYEKQDEETQPTSDKLISSPTTTLHI